MKKIRYSYIKLPQTLIRTGAYINPKNTDNECFKYAIIAALHPPKYSPDRISHYKPYLNEANWSKLSFPTRLNEKDFEKFERDNPNLPPLNVHVLDTYKHLYPFPYYVSYKGANAENAINIMYFQGKDISVHDAVFHMLQERN